MRLGISQFLAFAIAEELNCDPCNLGCATIDTEKNEIWYDGAWGPECTKLPADMEVEVSQYGDHITIRNSPKHKEAHYFWQRQFTKGKMYGYDESQTSKTD